jgi:hypothetical protein
MSSAVIGGSGHMAGSGRVNFVTMDTVVFGKPAAESVA